MNTEILKGKRVLVVGGTGSFGQKVASRLAEYGTAKMAVFSRDERKQYDMAQKYPDFEYIIGDVRNYDSISREVVKADIVFHAAALKQVPSCERFPEEAIATNCLGVANACRAANLPHSNVEHFVFLSTDKAVEPINAMGISKAMAERIVCAAGQGLQGRNFKCVRYGNVLGTRGSILPLWSSQFKRGRPLTITDPLMSRFVMNVDDSIELVIRAMGSSGEVLVKDAPSLSIRILLDIFRFVAGVPLGFPETIVGTRPGEKAHETLVGAEELHRTEKRDDFFIIYKNSVAEKLRPPVAVRSDTDWNSRSSAELDIMVHQGLRDMEEGL